MHIQQVHLDKVAIDDGAIVDLVAPPLAPGVVRLAIESFSITANNVTYARMGDSFRYWDFFPAPEGRGIVPMWGHASVIESACDEIGVGERVYGYLPMASHLDVMPGKISARGFTDTSAHRQPMSPIYNQYTRLAADPEHDPAREAERMIYGPLFKTGFIIEYFMRGEAWFGAEQMVLTSASSKTALGLASVAKAQSPSIKRIGLTSAGNVDFAMKSGLYDRVIAYEDIADIPADPTVIVDFAGNRSLLGTLHQQLGANLAYSCLVGATHDEAAIEGASEAALPGPKPVLFFAPDHFVAFFKQYGADEGTQMAAAAWHSFLDAMSGTIAIARHNGLGAARDQFAQMAKGSVDPARGIVIKLAEPA